MEVFDWQYYISKYPDLRNAGITSQRRAISHWNKSGKYENRIPNKQYELMQQKKENNIIKQQQQQQQQQNIKQPKIYNSSISNTYGDNLSYIDKGIMDFTHSEISSNVSYSKIPQSKNLLEENNIMLNTILSKLSKLENLILLLNNNNK